LIKFKVSPFCPLDKLEDLEILPYLTGDWVFSKTFSLDAVETVQSDVVLITRSYN